MAIEITDREFSIEDLVAGAKRPDAGAVVAFLGTVRDDGISGVEVEAYREVAEEELARDRVSRALRTGPHQGGGLRQGDRLPDRRLPQADDLEPPREGLDDGGRRRRLRHLR